VQDATLVYVSDSDRRLDDEIPQFGADRVARAATVQAATLDQLRNVSHAVDEFKEQQHLATVDKPILHRQDTRMPSKREHEGSLRQKAGFALSVLRFVLFGVEPIALEHQRPLNLSMAYKVNIAIRAARQIPIDVEERFD
jgi:hypothetical protein